MAEIAALGHFDMFVICDMGFPIPRNAAVIDLALVRGVPGFMQTLKAILGEVVVQEVILMDAVVTANAAMNEQVCAIFDKQEIKYKNFDEFREICREARFFVRTAEDAPCSNMILVSASGVIERVEKYNIEL
jgi:D-ribose pyranase